MRKLLIGRKIICNHCSHRTVQGTARVMRKILFFFCPACWLNDRAGCDAQMLAVTK
jgi:hypothetical protein